jgi:hypothetical protein
MCATSNVDKRDSSDSVTNTVRQPATLPNSVPVGLPCQRYANLTSGPVRNLCEHLAAGRLRGLPAKYEVGYQITTTNNHRDAIRAVKIAIDEADQFLGRPLIDDLDVDP